MQLFVTLLYSKETSKIFDKVKFTFIENEISNQIFNILSKNFYGTYKKVSKNGNFIWRFENSSSGLENFEFWDNYIFNNQWINLKYRFYCHQDHKYFKK